MVNKIIMICRNDCCIILIYKDTCPICKLIAKISKFFDIRNKITLRPMTQDEFKIYRAPVAQGLDGSWAIGFLSVAKRVFWELCLPNNSKYTIHGDHITEYEIKVLDGNHCYECRCPMGKHCNECKAHIENRLSKIDNIEIEVIR